MITPGALIKMGTEIVTGLREILTEIRHMRTTMDRGLGDLLTQMQVFTERLDSLTAQVDRGMAMLTSVIEDDSVLADDATPDQVLRRAAAAARRVSAPEASGVAAKRKPKR